ncbi:MAG: CarD family transcriptional regulator, partial [Eubacterium sp.]|nr:CarD family transcriptional regulator [Eubacterium sp.]
VSIREVISREAAAELLDRILEIEPLEIHEEKFREEIYREVMRQSDCTGLLGMIRTLLRRREIRLAEGRKFTSVDERFLNEAMNRLSCELAIAMNETQEQAEQRLLAALQAAPV